MANVEEELKKFRFRQKIEMRWSDMDELHHVNNAVYLTYFEQARVSYFQEACQWNWKDDGVILANAQINYIRPLCYGDPAYIYVRVSRFGNKSFEVEYLLVNEYESRKERLTTGATTLVMFDYKTQAPFTVPDRIKNAITAYEPALS